MPREEPVAMATRPRPTIAWFDASTPEGRPSTHDAGALTQFARRSKQLLDCVRNARRTAALSLTLESNMRTVGTLEAD
jgi:hypothetical protein